MADFKEIQVDGQVYQVKDETARNSQGGYEPPTGGIPKTDLASDVQTSLGKADTSLQPSDKTQLQSAINSLQSALDTLIGSGNVQGVIDTFNEVKAFLNGIDMSDPTLANQLLALNNAISALQTSLAAKANSADVYSKSEVDDKVANAGKVKSVTINGQKKFPNEQTGDVDLGPVTGEKGDKGDTGNVQVDGNGNVLIYNGRDKDTTGAALDAYQGQFIGKLLNAKDNTFYNVWVGTQAELEALEEYEDNTIFIVGTIPTVVQRFNVSFNGGDHTSVPASTPQTVKEGSAFSVVVSPASGYTIDSATGTMAGGGTLTKTNNQDGTVAFSTTSVTGAISIQAAATIHIIGITVSAGTRTNNSIQMTAAVNPADADNVTLAWSISEDGTNYSNSTTHFGINSNGVLTIKEGANNASVTVKCADTNAASDTKSGALQLTGLSYEETPISIMGITDITATRTAANTLRLEAVTNPADANTPTVTYSLVGTVPTVKQVRRWAAGDTVDGEVKDADGYDSVDVPVAEISGNKLTYKTDCQVTVRATAGSVVHDEVIDIVHDDADVIFFEDSAAKTIMLKALDGSAEPTSTEITYAQAASITFNDTTSPTGALVYRKQTTIFSNQPNLVRFKEAKYFTGLTKPYFSSCAKLEVLELADTTPFTSNVNTTARVMNTGLKEFVFTRSTSGLNADNSFINNASAVLLDFRKATMTSLTTFLKGCAAVKRMLFGDALQTVGTSSSQIQFGRYMTALEVLDFGTGVTGIYISFYNSTMNISVIIRKAIESVDEAPTISTTAGSGHDIGTVYVPDECLTLYQAKYTSRTVKGISELPNEWKRDTDN